MTGVIIQARMSSTRLPGKILLPFHLNNTIIDIVIDKIRQATTLPIIVATTVNKNDDILVEYCERKNIKVYRGSENNVLARFIAAADHYGFNSIIRICSDNPFLDVESLKTLIDISQRNLYDYISFDVNGIPSIKTHFGFWSEYLTVDVLKRVQKFTSESVYLEHVTNYIYGNPDVFNIYWIPIRSSWSKKQEIRLTTDTSSDFNIVKRIYADVVNEKYTVDQLIEYITQYPEYITVMKNEIIKNSK